MGVLLDTNFYLSLIHPKDPNAQRGAEILQELSTGKYGLLYTSNLIIAEVTTLTAVRTLGNPVTLKDLEDLLWGDARLARILRVTPRIEKETWNLFKKVNENISAKKGLMSFVDLSCVILAQKYQLDAIVSFDQHFERFIRRLS